MMSRPVTLLAATLASALLLAVGAASADEDSPLHKIMEKVAAKNTALRKNTRTAIAFKKGQKDVVEGAEELVKLAKEAREIKDASTKEPQKGTDAAKVAKPPYQHWTELNDEWIKAIEELAKAAGKADVKHDEIKASYTTLSKSCATCHAAFKSEDM